MVRIDVWSDLLCPFCHLGRRHLALALEGFEHADEVDIIWHSYQLDRNAPAELEGSTIDRIAEKYGTSSDQMVATHEQMALDAAAVGLDFQWEKLVSGNSYDAHRLLHFARSIGREQEVTDRIMRAWYSEGASIGNHETLTALAVEAGLEQAAVRELLAGDEFGQEVRTDLALASQIGITSVPTFVLDQKFGVTGAQPPEVIRNAIRYAWEDQGNVATPASGGGCGGGCCGGACGSGGADETDDTVEAAAESAGGCGGGGCGACGDATDEPAHEHATHA